MLRVLDLGRGDPPPAPSRVALDPAVVEGARAILARVREEGDDALVALTKEHDGAEVAGRLRVDQEELEDAVARLDRELARALDAMADRLREVHARQMPRGWEAERDGVRFGEVVRPLRSAGCYAPGGLAAYPSTVLMTLVPARVAGVPRVVLCTPPHSDGRIPDAVLYAARAAGADAVYRVGGAQAVGAMAYGTETIPAVDVIVGPGNVWVTAAKREVAGEVGIDALAGPTELALVVDASADPATLAVDLVAQAEHDPLARTWLVCLDPGLPERVLPALRAEVEASPRREIVEEALRHAAAVVAPDLETAARVVDDLAPEHLQIVLEDPRGFLERVRSFGAAFLGPHTPVSFGDYGVGSNHVLPTMGTARFASGLRAADFVTVSSFVEAEEGAPRRLGPSVEAVARAEGLHAHGRASEVRRS
jgi:histidinol dehydrogenase